MMFIVFATHPAFRSSANVRRRLPQWLAYHAVTLAGVHHDEPRAWRSRRDVEPTCRAFYQRGRGTSLARSMARRRDNSDDMSVSSKTGIDTRASRARVKMLNNEIVFDIPRAVPEHVRPTREQLIAWHRVTRPVRNVAAAARRVMFVEQRIEAVGGAPRHHTPDSGVGSRASA